MNFGTAPFSRQTECRDLPVARPSRMAIGILALWLFLAVPGADAREPDNSVVLGVLTCLSDHESRRTYLVYSVVNVECRFAHLDGEERYRGRTGIALGIDLSWHRREKSAYTVIGNRSDPTPYALSGRYLGVKASVTPGIGGGLAILAGGGKNNISLQPFVVEASVGAGLAGGFGYLVLEPPATSTTPVEH